MTLSRRVETFVAGYVAFQSESTPFTALAMQDLDTPPALTNFALTDRTKQYLDFSAAITVLGSVPPAAAAPYPTANYTLQRLGAIARFNTALAAGSTVQMSGSSLPTYFMKGARAMANSRTAAKIDTTGSGDSFANGVPGRPDVTVSFTLVTGAKVTNKAGKLVTLESMLLGAATNATQVVFIFIDDTTDPLQPRDAQYCYIGTAGKTRAMGAAVERTVDGYIAIPDDGTLPVVAIDFIA